MARRADTALITGASAGLGKNFAHLFAADGYDVVLVARRKDRLEALAADLEEKHGVSARVLAQDLGEPGAAQAIFDAVAGLEIGFLVNNAGFGSIGAFSEQELARELSMIQVNVTALTHLTGLFLPAMIERGRGRILNVGSTAGFQPGPFMAVYYATKAFVNHYSEALSYELKDTGVTVTLSCPGPVATEFGSIAGNDKSTLFKTSSVASSEEVASEAYRATMAGKTMVIHGASNKVAVAALRLSPRSTIRWLVSRLNQVEP